MPNVSQSADGAELDESREAAVAEALGSAARELLPVSADAAATLAAKALDHAGRATARTDHVVTAVDAFLASGQLASVIDLLGEALDEPLPESCSGHLTLRFAQALIAAGKPAQAAVALERALGRRCGPGGPGSFADAEDVAADGMRASLLAALSFCDPERAGAEASRLLAGGRPAGTATTAVVAARSTLADLAWQDGAAVRGLELAREAAAEAEGGVMPLWRLRARLDLARKLSSAGHYAEAESVIRRARAEGSQLGPAFDRVLPAITLARTLTQAGQLDMARQEAELALHAADETDASLHVPYARYALAATALRMGDLAGSQDQVRHCREGIATAAAAACLSAQCAWLDIQLAAALHGPRRAASVLAQADPRPLASRSLLLDEPGASAWFVRLGTAVRNRSLASRAATAAEELASQNPGLAEPHVAARHARGVLDQDADALGEAAVGYRDPWARAWACADLADCLAGRPGGEPGEIVRHRQAALATFEQIGASRDAARVREELRGMGVLAPSAELARKSWEEFSQTEQTVTFLVGQGLTNGQIATRVSLSPHTVNYHLRRIFRKLGVKSRVELARMAHHLQLEPPFSGS